jgi:hypothetical protein
MPRVAIVILAVLAVAVVGAELFLPAYVVGRVEERLTEGGGSARVSIEALPALRLLAGDGDRIAVEGEELDLDLVEPSGDVLDDLDGFGEVDVVIDDLRAGPLDVGQLSLERDGSEPYRLRVSATTTGRDLASHAGGELGGSLGALAGRLAAGTVPLTSEEIPIDLDAEVRSDDGRPQVERVDGEIAGLPATPLVEALASALADRL